jgi:signal transduction histidine kinase
MEKMGEPLGSGTKLLLLPGFATFIVEHHKDEFLSFSRQMLRKVDIPLLRGMTREEGDALADKSNVELLLSLSHRNPAQHIERAVDRWRSGQFPRAKRNHFVVDDVTGIGHTRKLSFLEFLPRYSTDPKQIIAICAEIDEYILDYTSTTLHSFVGIIDDRIHEYVEHLERRTRELQESNTSLEEFAYAASHDLKEPLRKISIFIKLLGESMTDAGDNGHLLLYERILSSTDRMRTLIDDLLSLSVLSHEREPEKYSLKRVFDDVMQLLDRKIEETGAIIRCNDLPEASIIPSQFSLLFQNLLSNSLKFARKDGVPEIDLTHRYFEEQKLRMLEITVTDNGIGFDNVHGEKIFAVFQRLHNIDEYEGTGIGLAICKRIAKNHKGTITATGEPGKGATFKVVIPA